MSPDFFLKVKKGFSHDHAILAACLFMSCSVEDNEVDKSKLSTYVPLEHRVFICLGTLKYNSTVHAWILTFNSRFDGVVLWDIQENLRFELKGRVEKK